MFAKRRQLISRQLIPRIKIDLRKLRSKPIKTKVSRPKARISQVRNGGFESGNFFPWRDVGNVSVTSGFPRTGQYAAFFVVLPNRSASITQQVRLGPSGPRGIYVVSLWAARTTSATNGTLVVSLSRSVQPPLIIPFRNIGLLNYRAGVLSVPASALTSRTTDLRIEANAGPGTRSVGLEVDDVRIQAL